MTKKRVRFKNAFQHPVYVKPEKGTKPIKVPPGGTYDKPFDGFATPHHKPDRVYKVVDDVDVRIREDGSVDYSSRHLISAAGQLIKGGWKKEMPNDWNGLFDSARTSAANNDKPKLKPEPVLSAKEQKEKARESKRKEKERRKREKEEQRRKKKERERQRRHERELREIRNKPIEHRTRTEIDRDQYEFRERDERDRTA